MKVKTRIRIGGIDPGGYHNRRPLSLQARADLLLSKGKRLRRVLEKALRELGRTVARG